MLFRSFGVDRIDYLLRDAHHAGVAYGKFDHYRLIDTLRILVEEGKAPALGVEQGGLQSAEALLLARYFMWMQIYLHPVRRIYDIHLMDFLAEWLPGGKFDVSIEKHLQMTDDEVRAAMRLACQDPSTKGQDAAMRICNRGHYKVLYQRSPQDLKICLEAGDSIYKAASNKYGAANVRQSAYTQKGGAPDFPVLQSDGRVISSLSLSETLPKLPVYAIDFTFIEPSLVKDARAWLEKERTSILSNYGGVTQSEKTGAESSVSPTN